MSSSSPIVILVILVTAMTLVTYWRKVLHLLLSAGVAVFLYGLVDLVGHLRA